MSSVLHDVLLAIHFLGLFMGGAAGIGLPVIGATAAGAPAEHRATLGQVAGRVKRIAQMGIAALIVTGLIMATMGGVWSDGSVWFWIKLLGVASLVTGVIIGDKVGPKAMQGDPEAAATAKKVGMANLVSLAVIVFAASFAFH